MEVLTTDGSSLSEGKIDENTTVSTEMEYNITSVTSKNDIVDHIHDRKVETTKGKSKPRNIPLVSTSNHDIIYFSSPHLRQRTDIYVEDFLTLRKGAPLSSVILNFALSKMASKNPGPSLILDCDIAQIISSHTWFLDDRLSPIFDKVWRDPEYELVLLPCCHNVHFYLLAAVLDERDPVIFVLESIGGSYAKPPPVTEQFKSVLEETRQMIDGKRLAYRTFIPEVPRQNPG